MINLNISCCSRNNRGLLYESYDTHKNTACGKKMQICYMLQKIDVCLPLLCKRLTVANVDKCPVFNANKALRRRES